MMAQSSRNGTDAWSEFEFRGRTFIRGNVPHGINKGQTFTVAARLAERYEIKKVFASGGCGLLLIGRDLKTETEVLVKTTLRYNVADYASCRDADGFFGEVKGPRKQLQTERRIMVLLKNLGCNAIPNPNDYVFDWNPQLAGPYPSHSGTQWSYDDESILQSEPYLVMERVDGEPASDMAGRLTERESLRVMLQICHVLKVLHRPLRRGSHEWRLVYQDLKPDNILVGTQSGAMLIDFGGCRLTVDGSIASTGASTPGYCAPESGGELTPATDSYTVGTTLYHMLTGRSPAEFLRSAAVPSAPKHVSHAEWDWERLQQRASAPTARFVRRCLAEQPTDRPADGAALFAEISELLRGA
jgi:serine/threonine protein kinase